MATLVEHGHDVSGTTAHRPTNPEIGQKYFDTDIGVSMTWDGAAWRSSGGIVVAERTFTQITAAAGTNTYTGSISIPAGATILDVQVHGIALWDGTAAAIVVGDDDAANGFFLSTNLKATDLLAGEANTIEHNGGLPGAYIASEQRKLYRATAKTISGVVTQTGTGTLGRTRLVVVYALPQTAAATIVAS